MEIEKFINIGNIAEISSSGFLTQREKLNPKAIEYLNDELMKLFYKGYKKK